MKARPWWDRIWSPWVGCPGAKEPGADGECLAMPCQNCWAKREEDTRFRHLGRCGDPRGAGPYFRRGPVFQPQRLRDPLRWRRPLRVFVCGRSDPFAPGLSIGEIRKAWRIMRRAVHHTFLVLTKWPETCRRLMALDAARWRPPPYKALANVWLGTSIWNDASARANLPPLLATEAAVRFASYELLGPLGEEALALVRRLDWLIIEGETGKSARVAHPEWVRAAFRAATPKRGPAVPVYFWKWGEWRPRIGNEFPPNGRLVRIKVDGADVTTGPGLYEDSDAEMVRVGRRCSGCEIDGGTFLEWPEAQR